MMDFGENITDKVIQWIISDSDNYNEAAYWYVNNAVGYPNRLDRDEMVKRYVEDAYVFGDVDSIDACMKNEILQTALAYVAWNEVTDAVHSAAKDLYGSEA